MVFKVEIISLPKLGSVLKKKKEGEHRSRLVAKEVKTYNDPALFAATPPLVAMKYLIGKVASSGKYVIGSNSTLSKYGCDSAAIWHAFEVLSANVQPPA